VDATKSVKSREKTVETPKSAKVGRGNETTTAATGVELPHNPTKSAASGKKANVASTVVAEALSGDRGGSKQPPRVVDAAANKRKLVSDSIQKSRVLVENTVIRFAVQEYVKGLAK
jgi:hypothetical protein